MSRGISWRQRYQLQSLLRLEREHTPADSAEPYPVAWQELDYGPSHEGSDDWFGPRVQWNIEQAKRRALRNLRQRGLVELGRYVFQPIPETTELGSTNIAWIYQPPEDHVAGQSRIMTGVLLTDAGRALAEQL